MASAGLAYETIGAAQTLFSEQVKAKYEELMATGQCDVYSIVNFNPVEIGLQGLLRQYKVPSPYDTRLPADVCRIRLPYEDKERVGHLWTCRFPKMYGKMIGAQGLGAPGEVVPQQEVQYMLPMSIAYTFLEHFSPIFMAPDGLLLPPSPKDARKFYGVLAFRGDVHTLEQLLAEEDVTRQIIQVPVAQLTMIGKTPHKTYRAVNYNLQEYLDRMFLGQKKFADGTISRAQQKWSEDQSIREISESDRIWYRWAIDLGYAPKPKAGDKTWLNEMLSMVGSSTEAKPDSRLRKCQSCRKLEPEPDTPFCSCGSPVNTFTTYMAGHPVADSWLMSLRGEEREIALNERKLRQQGFEEQGANQQASEPASQQASKAATQRGQYKGGKKREVEIDPTKEIPSAETTALPGEE
jgi:hypothetical protein